MSKRRAPDELKKETGPEGDAKRAARTDDKYVCRLVIPTRYAGVLIGKGGTVVNELRDTFKVQIAIPDSSGPERLVRVMSEDTDSVLNCVHRICKELQTDMQKICNLREGDSEVRMLVHQSQAGTIIGRGGEVIKKLRSETNTQIKMNGECCPRSSERICQVAGKPDDIRECLSRIIETLIEAPPRGEDRRYEPNYYDERVDYGGFKQMDVDRIDRGQGRGPRDDHGHGRGGRGGGRGGQGGRGGGRDGGYDNRNNGYGRNGYDDGYDRNRGPPPSWQPPPSYAPGYHQPQYSQPPPPGPAYGYPSHGPPPSHGHPPPTNAYGYSRGPDPYGYNRGGPPPTDHYRGAPIPQHDYRSQGYDRNMYRY